MGFNNLYRSIPYKSLNVQRNLNKFCCGIVDFDEGEGEYRPYSGAIHSISNPIIYDEDYMVYRMNPPPLTRLQRYVNDSEEQGDIMERTWRILNSPPVTYQITDTNQEDPEAGASQTETPNDIKNIEMIYKNEKVPKKRPDTPIPKMKTFKGPMKPRNNRKSVVIDNTLYSKDEPIYQNWP